MKLTERVVIKSVVIKLEWPVAACTQCAGELSSDNSCLSCYRRETRTVVKYLQGTVCPM